MKAACYPQRTMTRVVAIAIVLLAVLMPPLAMATAHCLAGDCEGFCVSAIAVAPVMMAAATSLALAAPDRPAFILAAPVRLFEPPPRPLRATV